MAGVDAVDGSAGAQLALRGEWSGPKRQLASVTGAAAVSPAKVLSSYDDLTAATLKLIVDAGNNSNLILDPDLDSFYTMDAVINRLPALIDSAGQAGDMQTANVAAGQSGNVLKRIDLAVLKGGIQTNLSAVDAGWPPPCATRMTPTSSPSWGWRYRPWTGRARA